MQNFRCSLIADLQILEGVRLVPGVEVAKSVYVNKRGTSQNGEMITQITLATGRIILARLALTLKHGQQPLLNTADIKRFKLRGDMRFQPATVLTQVEQIHRLPVRRRIPCH